MKFRCFHFWAQIINSLCAIIKGFMKGQCSWPPITRFKGHNSICLLPSVVFQWYPIGRKHFTLKANPINIYTHFSHQFRRLMWFSYDYFMQPLWGWIWLKHSIGIIIMYTGFGHNTFCLSHAWWSTLSCRIFHSITNAQHVLCSGCLKNLLFLECGTVEYCTRWM